MTGLRILTVRQPWAWAIIHGGKDVENRVRNIAGGYRGPVAIQAGAARFEDDGQFHEVSRALRTDELGWPADDGEVWAADAVDPKDPHFIYGAILGVVELVDVHTSAECYQASIGRAADLYRTDRDAFDLLPVTSNAGGLIGRAGLCSPWGEGNAHHLVVRNPRALAEPIPYRGALGLRRLDEETAARVMETVA